jgi:hypothetical protein
MASIISAGTTDSTSLNISGDKTGILQLASNNAVTAVTIDASQNVGIGTGSPGVKLDVAGTNNIRHTYTGATGGVLFGQYNTTGDVQIQNQSSAGIIALATNNTERMRINSSGNVSIGQTATNFKFTTYGTIASQWITPNAEEAGFVMGDTALATAGMWFGNTFSSNNGAYLLFKTRDPSSAAVIERMRISSTGLVGIGNTPSVKLDVTTGDGGAATSAFFVRGTTGVFGVYPYLDAATGCLINSYNSAISAYKPMTFQASDFIWLPNGTEKMRLNSSGQLVMATSTYGLNGQLQVGITASTSGMNSLFSVAGDQNGGYPIGSRGNSTTQGLIGFFDSSNSTIGSITKSGSSVAYNTSSDYRLKENIAPMTGALAKVTQLKPVTYKWKADGTDGEGFIAHELAEVCPSAVYGEKDAVDENNNIKAQGIDTSFLVATLTAAIQEQQVIINALTARLEALENK